MKPEKISFNDIPNEVLFHMSYFSPRKDQARLSQINTNLNGLMCHSQTALSKYKEEQKQRWQKAIDTASEDKIKNCLSTGYIPECDFKKPVIVKDSEKKLISKPIISILLSNLRLSQHAIYFDVADKLIKKGAILPSPRQKEEDYNTKADYFSFISVHAAELYIALRNNPKIIQEQDENGRTLLHYAATIGSIMGSNFASLILDLLFDAPGVDFSIKDNNGNTAVHIAAWTSDDRVTCQTVFPAFVEAAAKNGFDFSMLGAQGQSVLHIATRTSYIPYELYRLDNISHIIKNGYDIDLNVLSSSGSTALYYAINFMHFKEAHVLLNAGANPLLYGKIDRDPLAMIDSHLEEITNAIKKTKSEKNDFKQNDGSVDTLEKILVALQELKQRMLSIAENNRQEVSEKSMFFANTESKAWNRAINENEYSSAKVCGPGYGF